MGTEVSDELCRDERAAVAMRTEPVEFEGQRLGRALRTRSGRYVAIAIALTLVGLATWVLWPGPRPPRAPRERVYLEFTACLLTDSLGINDPVAKPVWAGLQETSLRTRAKVQYVAIAGPQTVHQAGVFANSLAQGGCRLIFAAGELATAGIQVAARHFPSVTFYVVGRGPAQANVSTVEASGDAAVQAEVRRILAEAASGQH